MNAIRSTLGPITRWLCPSAAAIVCLWFLGGCGSDNTPGDSIQHLLAGTKALETGDHETALVELTRAIEAKPSEWAYYHRARLFAERGEDDKARADIQAGLSLDPDLAELKFLQGELAKPLAQRFRGRSAQPPIRK